MLLFTESSNSFTFTVLNINTKDACEFLGLYGDEIDISINTMNGVSFISGSCATREKFDKVHNWFKKHGQAD